MKRFSKSNPCPACSGWDSARRGQGERCFGFLADDGRWAHCTREQFSGGLPMNTNSSTYAHVLRGDCKCGARHDGGASSSSPSRKMVATYDYRDATGALLFQVVRWQPKGFSQRRPDGDGSWIGKLQGIKKVLYRLPELLSADPKETVFVVEGEKDADNLAQSGLVCTTSPMGAGKWRMEYSETLRGRDIVLLPDHDRAGREHMEIVAQSLQGTANSIKIVALPNLSEKQDVSDWLSGGGTADALKDLAEQASKYSVKTRETGSAGDDDTGEPISGGSDVRPPDFADDALALRFTERYGNDLRYTSAQSRWNGWDECRWRLDETLKVFDLARREVRLASANSADEKLGRRVASAMTVAAVERLARSDRRHAATVDQWDRDPWLLNTPDGTVNLQTGVIQPHRREDYITKLTAASPAGACPKWYEFLNRVTAGDVELRGFLQRMAGYALTGITSEHALFFLHGTGGNGKSVFVNTIAGILGDYAAVASVETFLASAFEHHPTDLASLHGARLVTAIETEQDRRWAEAKIKAITGGDAISARFMRQDFFRYTPQFKLVIAGNHKPGLRSVDEAMRRRLNLIPFTVTITAQEDDKNFGEKLRKEWGGILQWAIEGCLAWQRDGLRAPAIVRAATEEYLVGEDRLGIWLDEHCKTSRAYKATTAALFHDWKAWCDRSGEDAGSEKKFSQAVEARGYERTRIGSGQLRGFIGLALKVDVEQGG